MINHITQLMVQLHWKKCKCGPFYFFKILKKWTILWKKKKENLQNKKQIHLAIPYPIFLLHQFFL